MKEQLTGHSINNIQGCDCLPFDLLVLVFSKKNACSYNNCDIIRKFENEQIQSKKGTMTNLQRQTFTVTSKVTSVASELNWKHSPETYDRDVHIDIGIRLNRELN